MRDDTADIRSKKAALRKEMIKKRSMLSADERAAMSDAICRSFLATKIYEDASVILLYKAYNNEVDTDMIFGRAISDKKTVAYPVSSVSVDGEPVMRFYAVNDQADLCRGYKGILEPDLTKQSAEFTGCADICIAPGVAFDRKCHRIGYGKGFYDLYISRECPHKVIGLAYGIQIADDFETEDADRAVDMVITESGIYLNEQ